MPPPYPPYAANQSDVQLPLMAWKECDLPGGHQANTPGPCHLHLGKRAAAENMNSCVPKVSLDSWAQQVIGLDKN